VLAVDPGSKRVGLAVSDPTGTIAQALSTVPAEPTATLASRLAEIAKAQAAQRIVVGLPLRLDGSRGPEAAAAQRLAHSLRQAAGLPVQMVDERLTTAAAERSLIAGGVRREKRRLSVDRVAATLLLQGHLDHEARRTGSARDSAIQGRPDSGEATSSGASASKVIRRRAAQELNPKMGRMGAEDPSMPIPAAPRDKRAG
jgi:putative Holliday junction resolvase